MYAYRIYSEDRKTWIQVGNSLLQSFQEIFSKLTIKDPMFTDLFAGVHNYPLPTALANAFYFPFFMKDCNDDGETAAGGRLLHLLEILEAKNLLVVVSRWLQLFLETMSQ